MKNKQTTVSYTLAAVAGISLAFGIAILSSEMRL